MRDIRRKKESTQHHDRQVRPFRRLLALFLVSLVCSPWSVGLIGVSSAHATEDTPDSALPPATTAPTEIKSSEPKQILELREEAQVQTKQGASSTTAPAVPLSETRLRQLAALLPPFSHKPDVPRKFEIPSYTPKPSPSHDVIQLEFPPKNVGRDLPSQSDELSSSSDFSATSMVSSPLSAQISPQGSVSGVETIDIEFDKPMVPITTNAVSDETVPVKVIPPIPGHWRWHDTSRLTFQPNNLHFPNATTYQIEIPAGTKSQFGSRTESTIKASFSTPAPRLMSLSSETADKGLGGALRPVIALRFNHPVDSGSVLQHLRGTNGKLHYSFKVVHAEDFKLDKDLKEHIEIFYRGPDVVLVQPLADFSNNAKLTIIAEPGIKSLEGPNSSETQFQQAIFTYGPLKIRDRTIQTFPGSTGYIGFSNDLDAKSFRPDMVTVTPAVENLEVKLFSYNKNVPVTTHAPGVTISGNTVPGIKYRIELSSQITDVYGQHLIGPRRVINTVLTKKRLSETKTVAPQLLTSPSLLVPRNTFRAMTPSENPNLKVWSLNYQTIRVSLYEAQTKDWSKFKDARISFNQMRNELNDREHCFSAFTLFSTKDISTDAEPEIWKESNVDLSLPIKSGRTHIIAVFEGIQPLSPKTQRLKYPRERYAQWIECSPADLSVVCDRKNFYVIASDALTGKPMSGAKAKIIPSQVEHVTDANGLAKFEIWSNQSVVELRDGLVDTFLPRSADDGEWYVNKDNGQYLWYHKTDRGLYRPGDTVFVKGWVRWIDWDAKNDWKKLLQRAKINYVVKNPSGEEIAKGFCENDLDGAFTCNFKLPPDTHLGQCGIDFSVDDITKVSTSNTSRENFSIGEFRRPEFELTLKPDKPIVVLGDVSRIIAHANYRSGASFPNGKVHWTVSSGLAYFRSSDPAYAGFEFGNAFLGGGRRLFNGRIGEQIFQRQPHHVKLDFGLNDARVALDGKTDVRGDDTVLLSCKSLAEPEPVNLSIESTVQDLNRQDWSQRTSVLVHPADIYIGMKLKQPEFEIGEEKLVNLIVSDISSKLQPDIPIDVDVTYSRQDSKDPNKFQNEVILQKRLVSSGSEPIDFVPEAKLPGTYWVTARVHDKQGRLNRSIYPFYVMTAEESRERKAQEELARARAPERDSRERVKFAITTDKKNYHVGDTATLTVTGKVAEGHGFLFIQNNRILDVIPFSLDDDKATIPVAVKESFFPGAIVSLKYFAPDLLGRRIVDYGTVGIEVPMAELELKVDVKSSENAYEPGDNAELSIAVKDGNGSVSNAQVAIAVVDESIFALQRQSWLNPRWIFSRAGWYHSNLDMTDSGHYRQLEPKPQPTELEIQRRINSLPLALMQKESSGQLADLSSVDKYTFFQAPRDTNLFQVEPTVLDERHYSSGHSMRTGGGAFFSIDSDQFKLRSDVNPLAYFNPSIHTGPDGIAKAKFKLPGNLTKYRVTVVALAGVKEFGTGSTTFQTNMPLMVSPSLPRFLNYTDKCHLCLLVHNKTSQPIDSEVIVRSRNLVLDNHKLTDDAGGIDLAGRKIHLPPQGRVEVRIPACANHGSEAVVQAAASAKGTKDAAEIVIPLQPPITTEAFASSGHVDDKPILEQVVVPSGLVPEVGGLKITTSSTAMQNLLDAGIYLRDYPFACSEQLSSQILGLTSLDTLLTKFPDASNLKSADIREILIRDVHELLRRQSSDGSFGLWKQGDRHGDAFVAAQCTKALWLASQHGIAVPELKLNVAKHYVAHIRRHIPKLNRRAPNVALRAHALNVLFEMGEADPKEAHRVLAAALSEKDEDDSDDARESDPLKLLDIQEKLYRRMSLETMAWLWPVLASSDETKGDALAVKNVLLSHQSSTSANAEFQRNLYGVDSYWLYYSDDRLNAVVLEALINAEPNNVLIPKLVKQLLESRRNGCWRNTQENSHALVALSKYFDTFEKQVPDFVSQLWLEGSGKDGAIYSEEKFAGRSMTAKQLNVPMEYLADNLKNAKLILAKIGDGRLYYRLEMKYAQKNLKLAPASRGFEVSRSFEAVGNKSDVTQDAHGTIRVKAGAVVKVKLKIESRGTRHHVALVDSLPAGFEVVDNSLQGNMYALFQTDPDYSGYRSWSEHSNLRDNRVEVFSTTLERGEHEYVYYVRATQLGAFIVPPCKIEEMYNPETFGRTGTEFVRIEDSNKS